MDLRDYMQAFMTDARLCMQKVGKATEILQKDPANADALYDVMRLFHSVKSSSAMMGFGDVSAQCLAMETSCKSVLDSKNPVSAGMLADVAQAMMFIEAKLQ